MSLKIIFDANPLTLNKSGVGQYTYELIAALAASHPKDLELTGYYFNFGGRKKNLILPKAVNINYIELKFIPGKVLGACRRLGFLFPLNLFIRKSADIVLSTNFVPTLKKNGAKQVVVVYDLSFIDCPEFVAEKNLSFLRKWAPKAIRSADLVITISQFIKQRIGEVYNVPESGIHVTPIPPAPHPKPDSAILKKHGLDTGYLLFVGTIEPRKNLVRLLSAYELLPSGIQNKYPLVLAGGKGWQDEETLTKITSLQKIGLKVVQTGYITEAEKSALYEHAALCIQPSHYEGFGMPILEAMSYGKPVACSDIPVLREVGGQAALYFNKNLPEAMSSSIAGLLNSPEMLDDLSKKSLGLVAAYPSWATVADSLYKKIFTLN